MTKVINAYPRRAQIIRKSERAIRPNAAADARATLEDGNSRAAVGECARGRYARHACRPEQGVVEVVVWWIAFLHGDHRH